MSRRACAIRVPASTSNIGPGFDVLGIALDYFLDVEAQLTPVVAPGNGDSMDVCISCNDPQLPTDPQANLISRVMLKKLEGKTRLGAFLLELNVTNAIPLGKGLGSSGAAVIAGVLLANWVGELGWGREKIVSECVVEEGHPDNVAASCMGGMVASYMSSVNASKTFSLCLPFDSEHIRIHAVIPDYTLPTSQARAALPETQNYEAIVHNLQRVTVLTHLLSGQQFASSVSASPQPSSAHLTPSVMRDLLDDALHQPYRAALLPGFTLLRDGLRHAAGVLGVCVSGAGPTVLVLSKNASDSVSSDDILQVARQSGYSGDITVRQMQISEGATLTER
ncbi:Trihydroxynaphthalene reductase [Sorochytrium milnesiophthora]